MKSKCHCGGKIVLEKRSSNYYSADGKEYLHGDQKDVYICLECRVESRHVDDSNELEG